MREEITLKADIFGIEHTMEKINENNLKHNYGLFENSYLKKRTSSEDNNGSKETADLSVIFF